MGVNVVLYRGDREEHPEWDCYRHVGDRDMITILEKVGFVSKQVGQLCEYVFHYRPKDVVAFRHEMIAAHPENEIRWLLLCDILADPDWWIYFSI